ncbi:unnamed protein product, partial [Heligmosomoides polygyrus]|uniref:PilZ domain-containing protein n=1 Tax=Heligmosomoides polygyrus TaxID=6339 RepID=A0A183FCX6_HELPZ
MVQLFNVGCSALSAINFLNDDKRTHEVDATVPSISAYPLRLEFILDGMSSECGWTNQRPVYLRIVGAQSLCRAIIQNAGFDFEGQRIHVRVAVPSYAHRGTLGAVRRFQRTEDGIVKVTVCVKLGRAPTGADPVYDII